jgi:hypothetical protein
MFALFSLLAIRISLRLKLVDVATTGNACKGYGQIDCTCVFYWNSKGGEEGDVVDSTQNFCRRPVMNRIHMLVGIVHNCYSTRICVATMVELNR